MTSTRYLRRARVEVEHEGLRVLAVDESLRVAFSTRRDNQADDAASEVKIYNLGMDSESLISEAGDLVRVMAGYGSQEMLGLVAEGEIRRVRHEQMGRDRVTTVAVGGSDRKRVNAFMAHSYQGAQPLKFIVADLVNRMGLMLVTTEDLPDYKVVNWTYTGKASDALSDLLDLTRYGWYEEFGFVKFSRFRDTRQTPTFVLGEASGLVASPSVTEDGVRMRMTLNTEMELSQTIEVRSHQVNGLYKITAISHRGDTWTGEFLTEAEAKATGIPNLRAGAVEFE